MTWQIIHADVIEGLRQLPADSVNCCITSPPYWGLRNYDTDGQIGLERTWPEYVAKMVEVFREVRRVLRPDGTLWLNLGDCYATGAGSVGEHPGGGDQGKRWKSRGPRTRGLRDGNHAGKHTAIAAMGPMTQPNRLPQPGLKPKDLCGMPWRVAFALQADGWWLRSDIVWSKPNPMPSSAQDRPTQAHEYLFLLAKSQHYAFDMPAFRELRSQAENANGFRGGAYVHDAAFDNSAGGGKWTAKGNTRPGHGRSEEDGRRNRRTVWEIPPENFYGEHFATMPTRLVAPCILAGAPVGGKVLDPFCGSGTVGVVACRLGRDFDGIELNGTYAEMGRQRIRNDAPLLNG